MSLLEYTELDREEVKKDRDSVALFYPWFQMSLIVSKNPVQ